MKNITVLLCLLAITMSHSVLAQETQSTFPKLENYTKGELEIKILSFGDNTPIAVGKVTADGIIHFDWPELDLSSINEDEFFTTSMQHFTGAKFCNDQNAAIDNENAKLVETKFIYLFKYDQAVGSIIPSTQKGQEHRNEQLGGTINWIYSYGESSRMANCIEKKEWEGVYNFDKTTSYNLKFKKGWNIVSNTLSAFEDYDSGTERGRIPKTKTILSIDQIPTDIHWHLKYWANDELLEIEQQLLTKIPIVKDRYESWLPEQLGTLTRTGYEIGKKLERMPTTNNINLLFEKESKKVDLTIVDCAGNKDAISIYTLMQDMTSSDWNEKSETGYQSASEMDGNRVLIDYNKSEAKTSINYNSNGRFLIKAEATNIEPEELWKELKTLNLEGLIKD